jgi:hypothetical protein
MGAWDSGPFDNDGALDFVQELEATSPDQRVDVVRATFTTVVDSGGYLDIDDASQAVAAAAVIASEIAGGSFAESVRAPDLVRRGGVLDVPADLPALALRALDRVAGDNSEWRGLWEEGGGESPIAAMLGPIREVLERGTGALAAGT